MSGGTVRTESAGEHIELAKGQVLYSLHFIKAMHYNEINTIYKTNL